MFYHYLYCIIKNIFLIYSIPNKYLSRMNFFHHLPPKIFNIPTSVFRNIVKLYLANLSCSKKSFFNS